MTREEEILPPATLGSIINFLSLRQDINHVTLNEGSEIEYRAVTICVHSGINEFVRYMVTMRYPVRKPHARTIVVTMEYTKQDGGDHYNVLYTGTCSGGIVLLDEGFIKDFVNQMYPHYLMLLGYRASEIVAGMREHRAMPHFETGDLTKLDPEFLESFNQLGKVCRREY